MGVRTARRLLACVAARSTPKTYGFAFPTAGTYSYHCSIRPAMVGQIVVE